MAHEKKRMSSFVVNDQDFPALSHISAVDKNKGSPSNKRTALTYSDKLTHPDTFCTSNQSSCSISSQQKTYGEYASAKNPKRSINSIPSQKNVRKEYAPIVNSNRSIGSISSQQNASKEYASRVNLNRSITSISSQQDASKEFASRVNPNRSIGSFSSQQDASKEYASRVNPNRFIGSISSLQNASKEYASRVNPNRSIDPISSQQDASKEYASRVNSNRSIGPISSPQKERKGQASSVNPVSFKQKDVKNQITLNLCPNAEEVKKVKKKRKSKNKRQAEKQSGKVTLMTPEFHSKIMNQPKAVNCLVDVPINVHDLEEYPELGALAYVKKSSQTKKSKSSHENMGKLLPTDKAEVIQFKSNNEDLSEGVPQTDVNCNISPEKKAAVHPNDPITIPFFDILLSSKPKVKESHEDDLTEPVNHLRKTPKKSSSHPHNILDSKPVTKRGKERENPKPKKPSPMKKIILMDRKNRKELQMRLKQKRENSVPETCDEQEEFAEEDSHEDSDCTNYKESSSLGIHSDMVHSDGTFLAGNESLLECKFVQVQDLREGISESLSNDQENCEQLVLNQTDGNGEISLVVDDACEKTRSPFENFEEFKCALEKSQILEPQTCKELECLFKNSQIFGPEMCQEYKCSLENSQSLEPVDVLSAMFNTKMHFKDHASQIDANPKKISVFSNEERLKAAKFLLHTRNFRDYCNHLPSKEIDDAVLALLADLVRFQDRLHQKDPVKAHIKRRMIYGIKEVKKHLKLRKVKCVILATDIENVQTEGGLNDFLFDLKQLAMDHHIPCVYALRKKKLGKLCRKPVAVSCLGIFNYEGSEANFKKILEFLNQSTEDYQKILNEVVASLSDDEIRQLFKAHSMAPETLCDIRTQILRHTFLQKPDNL